MRYLVVLFAFLCACATTAVPFSYHVVQIPGMDTELTDYSKECSTTGLPQGEIQEAKLLWMKGNEGKEYPVWIAIYKCYGDK